MKRLILIGIIAAGFGIYLNGADLDWRDRRISVVEEEVPSDGVMGRVTRVMEGNEEIYYRYEYPDYIIEENFSMGDSTDEFYDKVLDYERSEGSEYLVEIKGTGDGTILHRGEGEVCLTVVGKNNIDAVERALKDRGYHEEKTLEKLDLIREEYKNRA